MADDEPAGSFTGDHVHLDAGRAAVFAVDPKFRSAQADFAADAGRDGISLDVWVAVAFALSPGSSVRAFGRRSAVDGEVRAGGIDDQTLRRQFQLARADLVSHGVHAHHRFARL